MKSFVEILLEAKPYLKKGRMYVLKEPKKVSKGDKTFFVLAFGKDVNGNSLMRVETPAGKKKSVQVPSNLSLSIDEIVKNGLSKEEAETMVEVIF